MVATLSDLSNAGVPAVGGDVGELLEQLVEQLFEVGVVRPAPEPE